MERYELIDTHRVTGPKAAHMFAEAELTIKTYRSAPYGYGSDTWEIQTIAAYIHTGTGLITVDPDALATMLDNL